MASAEEYAQWIVSNADKKGTPEFDTVAKAYDLAKQQPSPAKKPQEEAEPSTLGFVSGNINKGIAGLAGLPVDTARNVMNLGIAGYGTVKGALGGKPPDLIPPGPGGSEWFENLGKKAGMIGQSAEPESSGGRYAAAGLQALPSALVGRPSIAQMPRALGAAATSGVGSAVGGDIAGPPGAAIGAMAPGMRRLSATPPPGERAATELRAERFVQAKELGIPIPPREMKPDPVQQKIQNALAKELNLPEGTELSANALQKYRNAHYAEGYEPVIKEPALQGVIGATPLFKRAINKIAREEARLRDEFPGSVKDVGLQQVISDFTQSPFFTTEGAMAQIKRLREGATHNLSSASANDDSIRLGLTQRKIANVLEDLVEENVKSINKPELINNFRDARKAMAQSHAIEASIDPVTGKINPNKLAALQTEGAPLTGQLKAVSQVSSAFPGAVKAPKTSDELFTKRVTPMAVLHPTAMGTHWLTRLADPITTSKPYQELFVNPKNKLTPEQERLVRSLLSAQVSNQIEPPPQ